MNPTPKNIQVLLAHLAIAQPMLWLPNQDRFGNSLPTWDGYRFTEEDKSMAFGIGWLLSGLPGGGEIRHGEYSYEEEPHFAIETSQFAWTICLRAAALLRAIHEEDNWTI